jgi:hypothetical protein
MGLGLRDNWVVVDQSITYSVPAGDSQEVTVTVPGLKTGDFTITRRSADSSTLFVVNSRASADNTLAVTLWNTGGSTAAATETFRLLVFRPEKARTAAEL